MDSIEHCELCPRKCGVDRLAGARGRCGAGAVPKIFRWGPHHGEEPPISGTKGSGAVFFSHCPLGCLYCQNYPWTSGGAGDETSVGGLRDIFLELASKGCHNWNLVTPEPWLPFIREAADRVQAAGTRLPFVFNTSGYIRTETATRYRSLQDIVLTDLRYATPACAKEGSSAPDYPEAARAYLRWCMENVGPLETDANGIATRGTIVRLLVLPGHADEACENLLWLYNACGTEIHVSMMSQYTPVHKALETPGWDRTITEDEFEEVTDLAAHLGMDTGWTQAWGTAVGDDELLGRNMAPGEGSVGDR